MRGRKPTPRALKVLRGNPGKRPLNPDEPQPPLATAAAPAWLSGRALAHWQETAPVLVALGLLTQRDTPAWALACTAWGHARELSELLARAGVVIPSAHGGTLHPALRLADKWAEVYLRMAKEFGGTPASHVHLHVTPPQEDALDAFLRKKSDRTPTAPDKSRFFTKRVDPA